MKGIVITADNEITVHDFDAPLYESVGEFIGGYIKHVHPRGLESPYCMIVNDEGLLKGLPVNTAASQLYQTYLHGSPIVGTVVIFKDILASDGIETIGLDDDDIDYLMPELGWLVSDINERCGTNEND